MLPDEVVQESDIIFVAVKASVLVRMIGRLTPISDGKTRLFISLVPGVPRDRMAAVSTPPPSFHSHHINTTGVTLEDFTQSLPDDCNT